MILSSTVNGEISKLFLFTSKKKPCKNLENRYVRTIMQWTVRFNTKQEKCQKVEFRRHPTVTDQSSVYSSQERYRTAINVPRPYRLTWIKVHCTGTAFTSLPHYFNNDIRFICFDQYHSKELIHLLNQIERDQPLYIAEDYKGIKSLLFIITGMSRLLISLCVIDIKITCHHYGMMTRTWPDHFFDHQIYLNFFEILVPIDGSYFSHSHPEIWRSKIGYLRRNKTINNISVILSYYFKTIYKSVVFSLIWISYLNDNWRITDLILTFKQNLFSKVIWSSTFNCPLFAVIFLQVRHVLTYSHNCNWRLLPRLWWTHLQWSGVVIKCLQLFVFWRRNDEV